MFPAYQIVCAAALFLCGPTSYSKAQTDPQAFMSPDQIITLNGYTSEIHNVTTTDGYILTAYRIPKGKVSNPLNQTKEAILIMHGFINSASDFLVVSPERALPFLLADQGYDVWLGNNRGTQWSMGNVHNYTSTDPRFWNFNLNHLGDYDVPNLIDYVLKTTNNSRLSYIGFSQGTSTFFQTMSTQTRYNSKVRKMVALGPAAYINGTTSLLYYGSTITPDATVLLTYDLTYDGQFVMLPGEQFMPYACAPLQAAPCNQYLAYIGGIDPANFNATTTDRVSGHSPASASARMYVHWRQFTRTGNFARYDYGSVGNLAAYGTPSPPLFNLTKVTVPVYGLYGLNDIVVEPADAYRNLNELGNWVNRGNGAVNYTQWTHLDFVYADTVKTLVYDQIIAWLNLP